MRAALALALPLALLVAPLAAAQQGDAPPAPAVDPRLAAALRDAVDGRLDSARATLAALARDTPAGGAAHPDLLFGEALVARDAAEARRRLQRVVVEYPLSPWADDAALRLAQLEYAAGDHVAARRHAERFRGDYAQSPLQPMAALWGARAALAAKDSADACRWAGEGAARGGDDAATRTALAALATRCGGKAGLAAGTGAPALSPVSPPAAPPAVARDTARIPVDVSAGVPAATNPPAGTPSPASPSAGTGAAPSSTPSAGAWRVQIIAAPTPAVAERELARARKAGFDGAVVAEGGFHKVRLGGFATRADATAAAARVKAKLGGSPYVVRAP